MFTGFQGVAQSILYATPMLVCNKRTKYVAICVKKGVWHNVYVVPHPSSLSHSI